MMRMNGWPRLLSLALCLCLLQSGLTAPAAAESAQPDASAEAQSGELLEDPGALTGGADAEPAQEQTEYVATATVALKVRRSPEQSATGSGTIAQGASVYVLELGNEWCKVDTGRTVGYVRTQYLTDLRPYAQTQPATQADGQPQTPQATATPDTSGDTPALFAENFKAYAYKSFVARRGMGEDTGGAFKVSKYEEVIVSANHGAWSYIRYKNSYAYAPTDALFKWDRIDPYAGDIPGAPKLTAIAFLKRSVDIRSYDDNGGEVLKTVNPGSAIAVTQRDELGRYAMPYWRTTGFVDESDISYQINVVPWDEAQSGDMISCMSTYYAVGVHTLQYQGRNWNIYLATSFISGLVVHPGETKNIYDVMGPYRRSSGYHRAPIMSPNALWGYGGGTCQVNTTLYNALIQVPVYINWRKVHANVGIYYCPVGFDAAVGGGDITMIFTNTLPYSIRLNYFMSDGCMTVGIFRV